VTDAQVKNRIARGQRIRAVLAQPQYAPLRLVDEVALVMALQSGLLDSLSLELIERLRTELPQWLDRSAGDIVDTVERSGRLDEAKTAELRAAMAGLMMQIAPRPSAGDRETA
jgi:F-type H+/Na+-transporting ATPase subunit alpha